MNSSAGVKADEVRISEVRVRVISYPVLTRANWRAADNNQDGGCRAEDSFVRN